MTIKLTLQQGHDLYLAFAQHRFYSIAVHTGNEVQARFHRDRCDMYLGRIGIKSLDAMNAPEADMSREAHALVNEYNRKPRAFSVDMVA